MPICVSCGTDNEEGARYCRECGVELGRATTPDTHPDTVVQGESWTQEEQRPDTHPESDTVVARESWTQEAPPTPP